MRQSFDTYENTDWTSSPQLDSAWVTYTLSEKTRIDDICLKMKNFRATSYPIEVYAGNQLVWRGVTPKAITFTHIPLVNAPVTDTYTIRLAAPSSTKDAFGAVKELDGRNDEQISRESRSLKIIEIEFLKDLK